MPIQHGLYAAAAGTILYALFGTARQISTGPSSALAAVAGSAVVLAAVLTAGVLAGVIIGVALSLVWLVYINATPEMPVLGRRPGPQVFRSVERYPDGETYPGMLILRFDAGLFFASADALEDRLRELAQAAGPRHHTVVLSFEGVDFIDSQGSAKLAEIVRLVDTYGAELRVARVKPQVQSMLSRDGVLDDLGEDRIFGNLFEAIKDKIDEQPPPSSG